MSMTAAEKAQKKEDILKRLSSELIRNWDHINNITGFESLSAWQKSIRGGKISLGGEDRLVMYQYDRKALDARDEEMMEFLISLNPVTESLQIVMTEWQNTPGTYYAVITGNSDGLPDGWENLAPGGIMPVAPGEAGFSIQLGTASNDIEHTIALLDNLSQFVSFDQSRPTIDPDKAKEILDTTIYELLPGFQTRQEEIDDFFAQYERLRNPDPPESFPPSETYNLEEIYFRPDNPNAKITRAGEEKTLEYIYNDLTNYFDQSEFNIDDLVDQRPRYIPKSSGYMQIRNLNQAIIIRNMESDDVGLGTRDNPTWQSTGFTITMWVKFLDKVSSGTLFNLGNPLRAGNPYGFMLETYVAKKTSDTTYDVPGYHEDAPMGDWGGTTWEPGWAFTESDTERFIRLVVRDHEGNIRDSHIGNFGGHDTFEPVLSRLDTTDATQGTFGKPALEHAAQRAFQYTRVPIDLQEWYFIVATYSHDQVEDGYTFDDYTSGPETHGDGDFWRWNKSADLQTYTSNSGLGAKCKVEIISKTDLLRARGYRL